MKHDKWHGMGMYYVNGAGMRLRSLAIIAGEKNVYYYKVGMKFISASLPHVKSRLHSFLAALSFPTSLIGRNALFVAGGNGIKRMADEANRSGVTAPARAF